MNHTAAFYLKRITGLLLLLALSAVFLFSAGSKLWFIEPFVWSFTDILPVSITAAAVMARLFIGLELAIGLYLLAHIFLKRFTYKASLALLIVLTLYLLLLIIRRGNTGSCGCFGEAYQLSPLNAVWKNLGMIAATMALFYLYPVRPYKYQPVIAIILALAAFALPFALNPVYLVGHGKPVHRAITLDPLYQLGKPAPPAALRQGKHVLVFLSLTCPHCRKAGYYIQIMHRQHPELPFYAVLGGHPAQLKDFLDETKSGSLPHSLVEDGHGFSVMAGNAVPAIYFVNNGVIERELYYPELDPADIRTWLK